MWYRFVAVEKILEMFDKKICHEDIKMLRNKLQSLLSQTYKLSDNHWILLACLLLGYVEIKKLSLDPFKCFIAELNLVAPRQVNAFVCVKPTSFTNKYDVYTTYKSFLIKQRKGERKPETAGITWLLPIFSMKCPLS